MDEPVQPTVEEEPVQPQEPEAENLADPELADPDLPETAADYEAEEEDA